MAEKTSQKKPSWIKRVLKTSDAMDLEPGVFKKGSAKQVAESLAKSAEQSERRKSSPFRSAMSMLNFHLNRAGKNLTRKQKQTLERAKDALRKLYGRA